MIQIQSTDKFDCTYDELFSDVGKCSWNELDAKLNLSIRYWNSNRDGPMTIEQRTVGKIGERSGRKSKSNFGVAGSA